MHDSFFVHICIGTMLYMYYIYIHVYGYVCAMHVCMSCIYYVFKYFDWIEILQEEEDDD